MEKMTNYEGDAAMLGWELALKANEAYDAAQVLHEKAQMYWNEAGISHGYRFTMQERSEQASHEATLARIAFHDFKNAATELIGINALGSHHFAAQAKVTAHSTKPIASID